MYNNPTPPVPPTPPYVPGPYAPVPRKKTVFDRTEKIMALVCVLLAYLFVRLVLFRHPGFGATVFAVLFYAVAIPLCRKSGKKTRAAWIYLIISMVFCLPFSLFADSLMIYPCLFLWMVLTALWLSVCCGMSVKRLWLSAMRVLFAIPLDAFGKGYPALGQCFKRLPAQKTLLRVLIGLAVALPLTGIVALLLTSADSVFGNMMQTALQSLSADIFGTFCGTFRRLGFTALLFPYFFGLFYGCRHQGEKPFPEPSAPTHHVPTVVLCTAVIPLLLLYAVFFCAQLPYYFSAFRSYLPEDYTVATFARRGFFELCVITCINAGVLLLIQYLSEKKDGKAPRGVRICGLLLTLFTLLLVATAERKMLLYIGSFGLTKLRMLTGLFMLFLAICLVFVTVYLILPRLPVGRCIFAVCITFAALLCFGNPDGVITKYNVHAYETGALETFDVDYLYNLSADAAPHVLPLLAYDDAAINEPLRDYLLWVREENENTPFFSRSLATYRALAAAKSEDA